MGARRFAVIAVVLSAGVACAHRGTAPGSTALDQERGPKGTVYAQYSGGIVMRTMNVSFRLNQDAFVLVGHLGGDGVIRVLYPESPAGFGDLLSPVRGNKTVWTKAFFAPYDGAPSLYTFRETPFRNTGAMFNSYDGGGHGYIFMIASRTPLRYDLIMMDGLEWGEVPVLDYERLTDPRLAIRRYAETLARGQYTLTFANRTMTQGFTSYAANAMDCSALGSLGLSRMYGFWGSWGMDTWARDSYSAYGRTGCAPLHYAAFDMFGPVTPRRRVFVPRFAGPAFVPPPIPTTPVGRRPTYRPFGDRASRTDLGMQSRTIPTTRGAGFDRSGPPTPPSLPSSRGLQSWASDGAPIHRPVERPTSYGPRAADRPSSVASDPARSRPPAPSTSAPVARPTSPAPSSTPATKPTTSSTTTTTKHQ